MLALVIFAAAAPAAGAYYYIDQKIIVGEAEAHVDKILADLDRQSFESEAQRAKAKDAVVYLLEKSSYNALGQGRFPYLNASGYADKVNDGVHSYAVYASGCYAYAKWASQVVYGDGMTGQSLYVKDANGNDITSVWSLTADGLKDFIRSNCQAGEHMRIDYVHSLCFLACTDEGLYFTDYAGDRKPVIRLCYATYEAFFNAVRTGSSFWLGDVVKCVNEGEDAPDEGKTEDGATEIKLTVNEPYISVNGEREPIDSQGTTPIILNDRTMLPIACVIRAMGGVVEWNGTEKTVIMGLDGKNLGIRINSNVMWDGYDTYYIDPAPTIIGGRTMVPLRAVVEYFGAAVHWDNAAKTVTIIYSNK